MKKCDILARWFPTVEMLARKQPHGVRNILEA
jgi:hypothetical protein